MNGSVLVSQEKRKQILNDIRGLSDVSHPTLVQFFGAYRSPDSGQISLVLELLDRGSLADLTKQVRIRSWPFASFLFPPTSTALGDREACMQGVGD